MKFRNYKPRPISDAEMELIAYLSGFATDEENDTWSLKEARAVVRDQYTYEIEHEIRPQIHFARDFYEIIRELIKIGRDEEERFDDEDEEDS